MARIDPHPSKPRLTGLVGRAFHWLDGQGRVKWRGTVIDDLGAGYYLLQLCGAGKQPTQQIIVSIGTLAVGEVALINDKQIENRSVFFDTMPDEEPQR